MHLFGICQKWLVVLGIIIVLYGLYLGFNNMVGFEDSFSVYVNKVFWQDGSPSLSAQFCKNWLYGIISAVDLAYGLFIIFIACIPFKRKEKWASNCLFWCISAWFIVDLIFSLRFKVYYNVLADVVWYVLLMLPLIMTRKTFSMASLE